MPGIDTLVLTLDAPAVALTRDPVPVTLLARNATERPLELYLHGREVTWDVRVLTPDGTLLWNLLAGTAVPAILRVEILQPGSVLRSGATWDQRTNDGVLVPAGRYHLVAELLTESGPLRTPLSTLDIKDRQREDGRAGHAMLEPPHAAVLPRPRRA
jgi:hypothetical protein